METEEQCPLKVANEMASHLIYLMETGLYQNNINLWASKMGDYIRFCSNLQLRRYYDPCFYFEHGY